MLLEPPGWSGRPEGLPHWPYVRAVDDALAARGIPPGSVRASYTNRDQGLTSYMWLTWDVSPTGGSGGLRLHWTERQGWYYSLIGMSPQDVLLYTVLLPFRTFFPTPQNVAEVAEQLVRTMRVPDVEFRTEWDGAGGVRAAARDFRRAVFGRAPASRQGEGVEPETGTETGDGKGVQLTIDIRADTFERAIAAVRAAYGHNIPAPVGDRSESATSASPPAP
ncbi:hypothetical protein SAMN05428938_6969 [Streptomyces sp. KS_5]|nr:hypothetical protein SAMN05428938_6969 [Streptomyces sp. KS_5]